MNKNHLLAGSLLLLILSSCVKQKDATPDPNTLKPPSGFLWEMSRNIVVSIGVNDTRFGDALHIIAIYNSDPATGGKLLVSGAASTGKPFAATLYLTDTLQSLFVIKTAPDNSAVQKELAISANSITAIIGAVPVPAGRPLDGPDCSTGCTRTITASNSNIDIKNGEVVCITGNNITVSYTANNSGTVRICGSNVTVENANMNNKSKLIITASGSVNFQNLNINSGIAFENYGTCSIANGLSPNGPVINDGTLNIGTDLSVNNTGSLINRGIISVKGSININSTGNTNRGTITSKDFTLNGSAFFTNICNLSIANDFNNNGTMANYQLITVGAITTVNGGAELGLYNSAMFTSKDIVLNGMIKGYGTTSIAKIANRTTINGGGGAMGEIQYCDANGIEVNNASKGAFTRGAVEDCGVYIPVSGCNRIGNGTPDIVDSDGDGIADELDEYPADVLKAFNNYYPADKELATVAFEDLWPSQGDYDFNDLVIDYRYNIITNAANKVATVISNYTMLASGGSLGNGFGIEFPLASGSISNVTGGKAEDNQAKAVIILFTNMRQQMQWGNSDETKPASDPISYMVSFDVKDGPLLSSFGTGTYNPFIWDNGRVTADGRNEIHLPGHPPTSLCNSKLFGTADDITNVSRSQFYLSKTGMPWALTVPAAFKYPKEGSNITSAYTHFAEWANSGGLSFINWYVDLPGNRETKFIYKP